MLGDGPGGDPRWEGGGKRRRRRCCGPLWGSVAVMAIVALQIASTTGLFVYFTMAISKVSPPPGPGGGLGVRGRAGLGVGAPPREAGRGHPEPGKGAQHPAGLLKPLWDLVGDRSQHVTTRCDPAPLLPAGDHQSQELQGPPSPSPGCWPCCKNMILVAKREKLGKVLPVDAGGQPVWCPVQHPPEQTPLQALFPCLDPMRHPLGRIYMKSSSERTEMWGRQSLRECMKEDCHLNLPFRMNLEAIQQVPARDRC